MSQQHSEKNPFDSIIEHHFQKDIQVKRIGKELLSLKELDENLFKISFLNSPLGLKVLVEVSQTLIENEQLSERIQPPVIFELLLDSQFPFNLPKLFCQTNMYEPSLADGRDFLKDTIQRAWSPTILLREVITSLPNFLKKVASCENPEDTQLLGAYHIGELYSLEDILGYENVLLFSGDEVGNKQKSQPRYFMVAESHFLIFEIVDKSKNLLKLVSYSNIRSIVNVRRKKAEQNVVIINSYGKDKQNIQYKLRLNEASKLTEMLIGMGEKYGVQLGSAAKNNLGLSYFMSRQQIKIDEDNIDDALEDVAILEKRLQNEISKDLVYTLMALYQKIVEHFASSDNDLVHDFVGRLRNLMEREDIQETTENTKDEIREVPKKIVKTPTEDTDIDEEEKKDLNEISPRSKNHKEEFIQEGTPLEREEVVFDFQERFSENKSPERVKKAVILNEEDNLFEENTNIEEKEEEKIDGEGQEEVQEETQKEQEGDLHQEAAESPKNEDNQIAQDEAKQEDQVAEVKEEQEQIEKENTNEVAIENPKEEILEEQVNEPTEQKDEEEENNKQNENEVVEAEGQKEEVLQQNEENENEINEQNVDSEDVKAQLNSDEIENENKSQNEEQKAEEEEADKEVEA